MNCNKVKNINKVSNLSNNLFIKTKPKPTTISNSILIPNTNEIGYSYAYSLNNTFFDPFQNSPPNEFIQKLEKRLYTYSGIK